MELIQWFLLLALGGAVAFLWKDRRANRVPPWVLDLQQDDWVTRAELDQYHLHVIQMSQAQRELINARFDEIAKPASLTEEAGTLPGTVPDSSEEPVQVVPGPDPVVPEEIAHEPIATSAPIPPPPPVPGSEPFGLDAPSRAITLFREGKTIDQIAQELRIGRQEAQLLIRMAQHKTSSLAGV